MLRFVLLSALFVAVRGQYPSPQNYPNSFSSQTTTPTPHPPAQVHYVNIGQDLAGDYKFGYDTGKGALGQSFREEARTADGTVKGAYGYIDAQGQQRIVRYTAGKLGFQIDADEPAAGQGGAAASRPASQPVTRAPAPQISLQAAPIQPAPAPRYTHQPAAQPAPQYNPSAYRPQQAVPYRPSQLTAAQLQYAQMLAHTLQTTPALRAQQAPAPQAAAPQQQQPAPQPQYYRPPQPLPAYPSYAQQPAARPAPLPLSAFPQLPGVRLIQIDRRPQPAPAQANALPASYAAQSFASNQLGQQSTPRPEEEYTGPVIINAALLNYDIGTARRTTQ